MTQEELKGWTSTKEQLPPFNTRILAIYVGGVYSRPRVILGKYVQPTESDLKGIWSSWKVPYFRETTMNISMDHIAAWRPEPEIPDVFFNLKNQNI